MRRYVPPDMIHVLTRYRAAHSPAMRSPSPPASLPGCDVAEVTLAAPLGIDMLGFAPPPAPGTPAMPGAATTRFASD